MSIVIQDKLSNRESIDEVSFKDLRTWKLKYCFFYESFMSLLFSKGEFSRSSKSHISTDKKL